MKRLLVTGGAGFIGSNFVRYMLHKYPEYEITVLDALTYAGNLDNLADVAQEIGEPRYRFVEGDISDFGCVNELVPEHDAILNFAAETHVDRSLMAREPGKFIMTDVYGTWVLLEAAKHFGVERFVQISTDEVYGTVPVGHSKEGDPLCPRSPYSASKAGGEMMVQAYHVSHGVPTIITRGSNNIGPYQYPEKVVPVYITNAIDDRPLPIYGDGGAVRDYIYVLDHCEAIDVALHNGQVGEVYNIGGGNETNTVQLADAILALLGKPAELKRFVADRPGHDRRYAVDTSKLEAIGWQRRHTFEQALAETVRWYQENEWWWRKIKSGEYLEYYRKNYGHRVNA